MKTVTQTVLDTICKDLEEYNLEDVAYHADVSDQTLYNWISGITESPRLINIIKVAEVLGYEVELTIK